MAVGFQVYDQEHEAPARRGNVVDLWGVEEDGYYLRVGRVITIVATVELGTAADVLHPTIQADEALAERRFPRTRRPHDRYV